MKNMPPGKTTRKNARSTQSGKAATGHFVRVEKRPAPRKRVETIRHSPRGTQLKSKVSVAIDPEMLAWANARARAQALSLSAVFTTALERARRDEAFDKALRAVGGADDITDDDMESVYAEWRQHGLID
jgi:uncharacterized protein (DUF2236 family)